MAPISTREDARTRRAGLCAPSKHPCYSRDPRLRSKKTFNVQRLTFNEEGQNAFSKRGTGAEAFAVGGIDSGDGEGVDRFLDWESDAAGPLGDHSRSAGRLFWNDAGTNS